jgi:hypothetical protein
MASDSLEWHVMQSPNKKTGVVFWPAGLWKSVDCILVVLRLKLGTLSTASLLYLNHSRYTLLTQNLLCPVANPAALKWKKQSASLGGGGCLNQTATILRAPFSWPYTHAFCIFRHRNSFTETTQNMGTSENASPSMTCRKIYRSYWIMVYHNKDST